MRHSIVFCLVVLLSLIACREKTPEQQKRPNFIIIFADDLGYGDLSCFGATDIHTPNIDRIAGEGIKFTEFYSASPVCSPSRAGLLTGRMPQRMGINQVYFPESFSGMPPSEITIAEMLGTIGYATGIVGKWHLGHLERFLPLQQGFDEYYGIPYSNDMSSVVYMDGNEVDSFKVDQRYTMQVYAEKAVDFIDRHQEESFFLYLAHNMPHVPIYASPEFEGKSNRGLYGDVVQELDWTVGEILKKLEEHQLLENTLLIFSSDNGPWLVMQDHGGSAGILREGKQFTFEGGVRVPTVAMWKGTVPPGQEYKNLATQMDWFPTFAHITGVKLPDDRAIDGQNIYNVITGQGEREKQEFLYYMGADLRCYRSGDWKIKMPFSGFEGAPWMSAVPAHDTLLFNLKSDPGERLNLFSEEEERVKTLTDEMKAAVDSLGKLPPSQIVRTPPDNSHYFYLREKNKEAPEYYKHFND